MGTPTGPGTTRYSALIAGDQDNFRWSVRFDLTDGTLGITQHGDDVIDRVLLSPKQVKALLAFLKRKA